MTVPSSAPTALDALWMPFTANRAFKQAPRLLARAEGVQYWDVDGHRIRDGTAGLWCVNAGHARPPIVAAIQRGASTLDDTLGFNMGPPAQFERAARLTSITPPGLDRVFFTNAGSKAVDTALDMVIAYHAVRGDSRRLRVVRRVRGYCGVGFGGNSVGASGTIARHSRSTCSPIPMSIYRPRTGWKATCSAEASRHTAPISPTPSCSSRPYTVAKPSRR